MYLKSFKPITNSLRNKLILMKQKINFQFFKYLKISLIRKSYKSFNKYIVINNQPLKLILPGKIISLIKSNFSSNFLILFQFLNGCFSFFPSTINQSFLFKNLYSSSEIGSICKLKYLRNNTTIHNIFNKNNTKMTIAKAAGTSGQFLKISQLKNQFCFIKLPSKKTKLFSINIFTFLGRADNIWHKFEKFGKAGYNKYFYFKPKVRGEAKNAVDHPHGGRTRGGRPKHTPWGWVIH